MAVSADNLSKFKFEDDGVAILKLCLKLTVFLQGDLAAHRDGILDFYQQSLALIRDRVKFYATATMRNPKPVAKDSFDVLPTLLRGSKLPDVVSVHLESGKLKNEPSDHAFHFGSMRPLAAITLALALPVEYLDKNGAAEFASLTQSLVRKLSFSSGLAGYAIECDNEINEPEGLAEALWGISQRYPGVDIPSMWATQFALERGIKCINWLTLLNTDLVSKLGGNPKLRAALGPDNPIHAVPAGVIVQAGKEPLKGDRNRKQTLPHYHAVGKLLAPVRAPEHPGFLEVGGMVDDDATESWLARFD